MTDRGLRAILTYHGVDPSPSPICIEDVTFRRHAAWLASGRVKVCALAELPAQPPDTDAVALTFDDGAAAAARVYSRACTAVLRPLSFREDVYRLPRLDARTIRAALAAPGA